MPKHWMICTTWNIWNLNICLSIRSRSPELKIVYFLNLFAHIMYISDYLIMCFHGFNFSKKNWGLISFSINSKRRFLGVFYEVEINFLFALLIIIWNLYLFSFLFIWFFCSYGTLTYYFFSAPPTGPVL